jgi:hypothetical protein
MTIISRQRTAVGFALLCLAAVTAPAPAQVPFSQLDSRINNAMRGKSADQVLPDQQQARANIDTRIAQLHGQVLIALSRGWIEPGQAARLYKQLDMVQAMETRARQGGLTVSETSDMIARLRTISSNISAEIMVTGAIQFDPSGTGTKAANLENERLYLQSRIDRGILLGQLSPRAVSELRMQMAEIARLETRRGGLTNVEQERLTRRMAELNSRINRYM